MRFQFKTSYNQDIRLFKDRVDASWYGLLAIAVLALPFLMSDYYVGETAWVFIYGICGVSLMVLVGYTGLVSLGHAAFLGIGAYAHAYFVQHGMPWVVAMVLAVALKAFAAAVLGGFGSIPGALVGGIVIGLIELYAGATLPDGFKDTAPYIVLLIMLVVRPQGLFGTMTRKKV